MGGRNQVRDCGNTAAGVLSSNCQSFFHTPFDGWRGVHHFQTDLVGRRGFNELIPRLRPCRRPLGAGSLGFCCLVLLFSVSLRVLAPEFLDVSVQVTFFETAVIAIIFWCPRLSFGMPGVSISYLGGRFWQLVAPWGSKRAAGETPSGAESDGGQQS